MAGAKRYKVVGPYVTLKVRQLGGGVAVTGFYEGAPVPEAVEEESLAHHLRRGLVAEVDAPPEPVASAVAETPKLSQAKRG